MQSVLIPTLALKFPVNALRRRLLGLFWSLKKYKMAEKKYFDPADLKQFGNITEFQEEMGKDFFNWYNNIFKEGALTQREKALIALAVAHAIQCPYCIDAYSSACLQKGADEEQMMEAVHVAAGIRAGTTLVYSTQMMNHVKKMTM